MDMTIKALIIPGLFGVLHFVGLILSLAYWRRCPKACSLLFGASIINLLPTMTLVVLSFWEERNLIEIAFALAFALQWMTYGILFVAIFADRNYQWPQESHRTRQFPDDDDWSPAPKSSADSTAIHD